MESELSCITCYHERSGRGQLQYFDMSSQSIWYSCKCWADDSNAVHWLRVRGKEDIVTRQGREIRKTWNFENIHVKQKPQKWQIFPGSRFYFYTSRTENMPILVNEKKQSWEWHFMVAHFVKRTLLASVTWSLCRLYLQKNSSFSLPTPRTPGWKSSAFPLSNFGFLGQKCPNSAMLWLQTVIMAP